MRGTFQQVLLSSLPKVTEDHYRQTMAIIRIMSSAIQCGATSIRPVTIHTHAYSFHAIMSDRRSLQFDEIKYCAL